MRHHTQPDGDGTPMWVGIHPDPDAFTGGDDEIRIGIIDLTCPACHKAQTALYRAKDGVMKCWNCYREKKGKLMPRVFTLEILAAVLGLCSAVSHAQTITMTMTLPEGESTYNCGNATSLQNVSCWNVPVIDNNGNAGHVWIYYHTIQASPYVQGWVSFMGYYDGLNNPDVGGPSIIGESNGTVAFAGMDAQGRPYMGTFTLTGYVVPCRRCGSSLILTSLNIDVTYVWPVSIKFLPLEKLPACDGGFYYYWTAGPSPLNWEAICSLEMNYTYTINAFQAYDLWAEGDNHYGPPDMNNGIPQ